MVPLFDVRHGEGRVALRGLAVLLLLVITGHTILEAARDALLLTGPGPRALGLVYMLIAVCAWPAAALAARATERLGPRRSLTATLGVAAALPMLLFVVPPSHAASMAVYVVSGLIGSIVVPQFWTLVGQVLTVAQGRRLFGMIAAAGALGGVAGSGAAAGALLVLPVRALLPLSSAVFVVAVAGLSRARTPHRRPSPEPPPPPATGLLRTLSREPLLVRIAASVVLSMATLLALDYCFKSTVARTLPPAQIGPFVARTYLVLNGVSLVVQLFLASAVVRRLGVTRALLLTPALLLGAAVFVVLRGGGLAPVLALKGADGGLRFSIHRITGELVYLPVPLPVRQRVKPLVDGALARAGQTVTGAGLLALGGTWLLSPRPLAGLVVLLASAWLAVVVGIRKPYLARLREAISRGTLHAQKTIAPLDLESAQMLVQRLGHEDALEVIGAMNALCRRGHVGFVPALVLLHGDDRVLVRALAHFGDSARTDWIPLAQRLLSDRREVVCGAAARALARHGSLDVERLTSDVGWRVRGYAAVVLAQRDGAEDAVEHGAVAGLLHEPGPRGAEARMGMLEAIGDAPPAVRLSRLLLTLAEADAESFEHTERVARAAARQRDRRLIPSLVDRLSHAEGREAVRAALVSFGDEALDAVWWALRDTSRPRRFRMLVPRTIERFGSRSAAAHLLENIETEEDGLVRYKSIRALESLVASQGLTVDRQRVERVAQATLRRHVRLLALREVLDDPVGARAAAERLLAGLLDDKIRQSLERVFRLLAIAHPREDLRRVRIASVSGDAFVRANAGELLDTLLWRSDERELRDLLRIVIDDLPRAERVSRAARLWPHAVPSGRDKALAVLAADADATVASLARRCVSDAAPPPQEPGAPAPEDAARA